jgi:hypothetical protein
VFEPVADNIHRTSVGRDRSVSALFEQVATQLRVTPQNKHASSCASRDDATLNVNDCGTSAHDLNGGHCVFWLWLHKHFAAVAVDHRQIREAQRSHHSYGESAGTQDGLLRAQAADPNCPVDHEHAVRRADVSKDLNASANGHGIYRDDGVPSPLSHFDVHVLVVEESGGQRFGQGLSRSRALSAQTAVLGRAELISFLTTNAPSPQHLPELFADRNGPRSDPRFSKQLQ